MSDSGPRTAAVLAEIERLSREISSDEDAEPILCPDCGHDADEHILASPNFTCDWNDGSGLSCRCRKKKHEILRDAEIERLKRHSEELNVALDEATGGGE